MADAPKFAEADDDRECYIPISPENAEEARARALALWAEFLRRWAAHDG